MNSIKSGTFHVFRSARAALILPMLLASPVIVASNGLVYAQENESRIFLTIRMSPSDDVDSAAVEAVLAKVRLLGGNLDSIQDFIVSADLSGEYDIRSPAQSRVMKGYHAYARSQGDRQTCPWQRAWSIIDAVEAETPAEAVKRLNAMQQERFDKVEGLVEQFQVIGN